MLIQIDNDSYVVNYATVGGFPDGIEIDNAPEDFTTDFWPRKWKYNKGKLSISDIPNPAIEEEKRHQRAQHEKEEMASASAIAFVTMAQAEMLDDAVIVEHPTLFSEWTEDWTGKAGTILIDPHDGGFYRSIHDVGKGQNTHPCETPSMWTRIGNPTDEWPEWFQPIGAHDAYDLGAKVSHGGKHWVSTAEANVWEPGVYGWEETDE